MELRRRTKVKCSHCQKVHHYKFECEEIKALKTFCGHDEWARKMERKVQRRKKQVVV